MTRLVLTVLPAPDSPKFFHEKPLSTSHSRAILVPSHTFNVDLKLTSNQHRLIVTLSQHVVVSIIRDGKDMWGHFRLSLALVTTNNVIVVYWEPLVGIDSDTEKTGIGVDKESDVSFGQVVDDGGFGEIGHVSQIFQKFVFWRILEFDFRFLNHMLIRPI